MARPDVPSELQPLARRIRVRFVWLALVLGAGVGLLAGAALHPAIGAFLGLFVFLFAHDSGSVLPRSPRAQSLVRARTWATVLFAALPFGPRYAAELRRWLADPALVAWALADEPLAPVLGSAGALDLARARSGLRALRGLALAGLMLAVLAAIALPGMPGRIVFPGAYVLAYVMSCSLLGLVFAGVGLAALRRPSPGRMTLARAAWLGLALLPPFGTLAFALVAPALARLRHLNRESTKPSPLA